MKTILQIFILSVVLGACSAKEISRGNYLFAEDVQLIQPQTSTKNDVLNILGTPTAKAVFDENTWYYVGLKTEKKGFMDEKVVDQQVYKIAFNEMEMVQSVSQVDSDPVDVPLESKVTPTSGNEVTFLQQVLGNIGKFNPPAQK